MNPAVVFLLVVCAARAQFVSEDYPERFFNIDPSLENRQNYPRRDIDPRGRIDPREEMNNGNNNNNRNNNNHNNPTTFEQRMYRQMSEMQSRVAKLERQILGLQMTAHADWNQTDSGSMYKLFEERRNWDDAEQMCQSFDAHLAVVDNELKNKFINSLMKESSTVDFVWIGMKTKTTTSGNSDTFSNFAAESPIDGCAVMDKDGVWSIRSCVQLRPFVCQKILARA